VATTAHRKSNISLGPDLLLMHTLLEVEQDLDHLVYKAVDRRSSGEDNWILNEINECAANGEALLRRIIETVAASEGKMERRLLQSWDSLFFSCAGVLLGLTIPASRGNNIVPREDKGCKL